MEEEEKYSYESLVRALFKLENAAYVEDSADVAEKRRIHFEMQVETDTGEQFTIFGTLGQSPDTPLGEGRSLPLAAKDYKAEHRNKKETDPELFCKFGNTGGDKPIEITNKVFSLASIINQDLKEMYEEAITTALTKHQNFSKSDKKLLEKINGKGFKVKKFLKMSNGREEAALLCAQLAREGKLIVQQRHDNPLFRATGMRTPQVSSTPRPAFAAPQGEAVRASQQQAPTSTRRHTSGLG